MRWSCTLAILAMAAPAVADPRPALDDFYDRTRDRADGFESCIGYCDGRYLVGFLVGVQTANPSTDALQPRIATGARLGIDVGARDSYDIARTKVWADVLRVHETGAWITDLEWQTTAFKTFGAPRQPGVHLALDARVARRTELEPSDVAELQHAPYRTIDVEGEIAPIGGRFDKDTNWAFPIGVANRLRWSDGEMQVARRTAVSGAIAFRGFPRGIGHHYQFDALRLKYTDWRVAGGAASSWTASLGFQRLSPDIDWLQIWLLAGYQWADGRHGPTVQLGAETHFDTPRGAIEIGPTLESHLELDPMTAVFSRIHHGRFHVHHRVGRVTWGLAYEAVILEDAWFQAFTPELAIAVLGIELGLRYRLAFLSDERPPAMTSSLADRFNVSLDWLF